jgi:hypothetical protein
MPLSMWLVSTCDATLEILRLVNSCQAVVLSGIVVRRSLAVPNELSVVFHADDPWEAALLSETPVDLLLCVGYPKKISNAVLAHCRFGGFNVHPSLLPLYPGRRPGPQIVRDQYLGLE